MVQELTNNPQNDRTMAAKNSNEKLPSSIVTLPTIILLHLMQTIASIIIIINNTKGPGKTCQKNIITISSNCKKVTDFRRLLKAIYF